MRICLSLVLAACLPIVAGAAPHRPRLHPSPLAILSIAEGPDGLLWLATSDGLYRYDGSRYRKITAFPFASARFLSFTGDGSLWCGGFGGLARASGGRFETLFTTEVQSLAAFPDQLFVRFDRLARVGLDGSLRSLGFRARRDLMRSSSGKLWMVCMDPKRACWVDPAQPDAVHPVELPSGKEYIQALPDSAARIWAADDEEADLVENGRRLSTLRRQRSFETTRAGPLLAGRNNQTWFLGETVRGLSPPVEFRDHPSHDRFPPTAGLEDRRGRLWVASLGQGLVEWAEDPDWLRWFPEDLAGEPAVQVTRDRQGTLLLATHRNIYRWNLQLGKWAPLLRKEERIEGILPLENGEMLASTRQSGVLLFSRDGKVLERLKDLVLRPEYREIVRDGKGRLWVGAKSALLRLESHAGSLRLREEPLPGLPAGAPAQAVDLELDSAGRLWAGYTAGIAWLDDEDRWHRLDTDQPVTLLRSFALAGDDIWVAYRRAGAFSRLHRAGEQWTVTNFPSEAGYGPVDTHFLKRDSRGWIWRGTPEGVFISDGRRVAPEDWIHLHAEKGLAGNQTDLYGFFEDTDGSVWISSGDGITRVRPKPSWFEAPHSAPPPAFGRIEADGRVYLFPAALPPELPADTKTLRVEAGSLDTPPFRDQPLRYRLRPLSEAWHPSRDGEMEFQNLPRGAYTLEVGFAGAGSSAVGTYSFRVGAAAWPLGGVTRLWLWPAGLLIAAGAIFPVFRYVPWFDRARFRLEKAAFVLRRRYTRHSPSSPAAGASSARVYSGETFLGRYQLGRIVSRGGFSVVYEARDLSDPEARLAVKVLNRSTTDQGWVRDRFAHEVAALRSVQHPGVVRILDSWISPDGEPCLAMPFLQGQTLRAALDEIPFIRQRVARIVRQLGAALAEVHSRGIIHRDLKPENLILLRPGAAGEQPVIIDFGTAGLRSAENELAATTLMSGSFHYMAPERLTGHYSAASDVFSLGVIILEMLTGKRLVDLGAMFSEAAFPAELQRALSIAVEPEKAGTLAARLGLAFDPEPRRRPAAVAVWAEQVAEALDQE
jgi:protein kinase-like protein